MEFDQKDTQYVVIGLGRLGLSVAETLSKHNYDVLAIDSDKELVELIADKATKAVQADCTDINVLKTLGVQNMDVAILAIGNDIENSIMTAVLLKELGVKYIVAKARNLRHKIVLEKIGVEKVILPEAEMGVRIAANLMQKNIVDVLEFSSDYRIIEMRIKKDWVGKTLSELDLRRTENINVIAIKNENNAEKNLNVSPLPDYKIEPGDLVVAIVPAEMF